MDPRYVFAIGLVFIVAVVALMTSLDRRNRAKIRDEVRRIGAEPFAIKFHFVGYDRDNQHYDVQFIDSLGRKHQTRCKASIWNGQLFWERTPIEFMIDLPHGMRDADMAEAGRTSSKEQIIENLVAENERLRRQLAETDSF